MLGDATGCPAPLMSPFQGPGTEQLPGSLWVKPSQVLGEKHNTRLGIQDNFLYCYQKAFISTMALDTIPSSGLWRELTVGTGCSENRVSHRGDALKV